MRRVRAQVDTGDREPAQLSVEEVSLNALGQGRRGRQDSGGENQGGAQPQSESEEEPMIAVLHNHSAGFEGQTRSHFG